MYYRFQGWGLFGPQHPRLTLIRPLLNRVKIKPVDVKSSTHIDSGAENNYEDSKPEIGDHIRTPKCRNNFANVYTLNWSKEVFVIEKVKSVPGNIQ